MFKLSSKQLTRKQNPFKNLSDDKWKEYVTSHKPHFTDEPYYELITWENLKVVETFAKEAGFKLILRTTNNTAYCPYILNNISWRQQTVWIFGYESLQLLICVKYSETYQNYETNDFNIRLYMQKELEEIDVTNEVDAYYENLIFETDYVATMEQVVGKTILKNTGYFAKRFPKIQAPNGYVTDEDVDFGSDKDKALFVHDFYKISGGDFLKPTFFQDLLNINKFLPGKLEECFFFDFSDNSLFLYNQPLCWYMDYLWLQELLKTEIANFVQNPCGFHCMSDIYIDKKYHSILEGRKEKEWTSVYHPESIFMYADYRFTQLAEQLIQNEINLLTDK